MSTGIVSASPSAGTPASISALVRNLPQLQANRELVIPPSTERRLPNGMTVITVPRRSVPLVELRLRVPFGAATLDPGFVARGALLSQTLFSGTADMSTVDIAIALQEVGADLSASVDCDRLLIAGNSLASGLDRMLGLLAHVLTAASYPEHEVVTERSRLIDRIQVALSQPTYLVRQAFLRRIYGEHPYAVQSPEIADLHDIGPQQLAQLHAAQLRPSQATLVIVGDIDEEAALDRAESALGSWSGTSTATEMAPTPPLPAAPVLLVDRAGSVQSSLRIALPAVGRTHPDLGALQLANLVFGGYFSSRWVENIREQKGYSYGPHSRIDHYLAGSLLSLSAEVGTEVTAPALLETWYELGRAATTPPTADEIELARQYALGSLLLGLSTQAGLASLASSYAGFGLRLDYLSGYAAQLSAASREDVGRAAAAYLAPGRSVTVVLGDAGAVGDGMATLGAVERSGA
jgi:zinc protease